MVSYHPHDTNATCTYLPSRGSWRQSNEKDPKVAAAGPYVSKRACFGGSHGMSVVRLPRMRSTCGYNGASLLVDFRPAAPFMVPTRFRIPAEDSAAGVAIGRFKADKGCGATMVASLPGPRKPRFVLCHQELPALAGCVYRGCQFPGISAVLPPNCTLSSWDPKLTLNT